LEADMDELQQGLKALEFLKDWSNFLLVTTVAALGWVAKRDMYLVTSGLRQWCIASLAVSIAFAIFTLALIPVVAERLKVGFGSIYDVRPSFDLFFVWVKVEWVRLKHVCWFQHVFFLIGILLFTIGASRNIPHANQKDA
jgi:hypothetical protein